MKLRTKIFLMLPVIFLFLASIFLRNKLELLINQEIINDGLLLIFFISALLEFLPQYLSPHLLLINFAIIKFPMTLTLTIIIIGSAIGSIIGFEIGKKFGRKITRKLYNKKITAKIKNKINEKGKWAILITAISPLPYVPMIFGAIHINRKTFLLFGLLPRAVSLVILRLILF